MATLQEQIDFINETLGDDPEGVYADVRVRIDILEARLNHPISPFPGIFYLDGYGGVSISTGTGFPTYDAVDGSMYLRQDGYVYEGLYLRRDGYWVSVQSSGSGSNSVVDTIAELKLINVIDLPAGTGSTTYVNSIRANWVLDLTSTETSDDITVVDGLGGGKWLRQQTTSTVWGSQNTWYINALTGDDENDGYTSPNAIKTWAEFRRRVEPVGTFVDMTVYIETDLSTSDPIDLDLTARGKFFVKGVPTSVYSGTVNTYTRNPAGNDVGTLNDAGWTVASYLLKQVEFTSGAAIGAAGWLLDDLGGNSARITSVFLPGGNIGSLKTPAPGDTFEVYSVPNVFVNVFRVVSESQQYKGERSEGIHLCAINIARSGQSPITNISGVEDLISLFRCEIFLNQALDDVPIMQGIFVENCISSYLATLPGGDLRINAGAFRTYGLITGSVGAFFNTPVYSPSIPGAYPPFMFLRAGSYLQQVGDLFLYDHTSPPIAFTAGSHYSSFGVFRGTGNAVTHVMDLNPNATLEFASAGTHTIDVPVVKVGSILRQLNSEIPFYNDNTGARVVVDNIDNALPTRSQLWGEQTTWHINASTGDDKADGSTTGTALATFAEFRRRVEPVGVQVDMTVYIETDLPVNDPIEISHSTSHILSIEGVPTITYSGTVTTYTKDPAANNPGTLNDASWTLNPLLGQHIVFTSGAANGFGCWLMEEDFGGIGNARVSDIVKQIYYSDEPIGFATPSNGDTFEVHQHPVVTLGQMSCTQLRLKYLESASFGTYYWYHHVDQWSLLGTKLDVRAEGGQQLIVDCSGGFYNDGGILFVNGGAYSYIAGENQRVGLYFHDVTFDRVGQGLPVWFSNFNGLGGYFGANIDISNNNNIFFFGNFGTYLIGLINSDIFTNNTFYLRGTGTGTYLARLRFDSTLLSNVTTHTVSTTTVQFLPSGYTMDINDGPIVDNKWAEQNTWYINALTGDNANDGYTSPNAIKTWAEFRRRVEPVGVQVDMTVYIETDLPASDPIGWTGGGKVLTVQGIPTVAYSGTVNTYTQNPAGNEVGLLNDVGWTVPTHVQSHITFTSGAISGYGCWVLSDQGSNDARITQPVQTVYVAALFPSSGSPSPGDTFDVETLPVVFFESTIEHNGNLRFGNLEVDSFGTATDIRVQCSEVQSLACKFGLEMASWVGYWIDSMFHGVLGAINGLFILGGASSRMFLSCGRNLFYYNFVLDASIPATSVIMTVYNSASFVLGNDVYAYGNFGQTVLYAREGSLITDELSSGKFRGSPTSTYLVRVYTGANVHITPSGHTITVQTCNFRESGLSVDLATEAPIFSPADGSYIGIGTPAGVNTVVSAGIKGTIPAGATRYALKDLTASTTDVMAHVISNRTFVQSLQATLTTAPGAGQTCVVNVLLDGAPSGVTLTFTNLDVAQSDTSHSAIGQPGAKLSFEVLNSAGSAAADLSISVEAG